MSASPIAICNLALEHVGAGKISSFYDGTAESSLCERTYDQCRMKVLTDAEWTFAVARRQIAKSIETPEFGYSSKFSKPADCLQVLQVYGKDDVANSPDSNPNALEWELESGYILADANTIMVRYIRNVEDANAFSPAFASTLSAYMAYMMANPLSASRNIKNDCFTLYKQELEQAKSSDAIQGRTKRVRSSLLVGARNR